MIKRTMCCYRACKRQRPGRSLCRCRTPADGAARSRARCDAACADDAAAGLVLAEHDATLLHVRHEVARRRGAEHARLLEHLARAVAAKRVERAAAHR